MLKHVPNRQFDQFIKIRGGIVKFQLQGTTFIFYLHNYFIKKIHFVAYFSINFSQSVCKRFSFQQIFRGSLKKYSTLNDTLLYPHIIFTVLQFVR